MSFCASGPGHERDSPDPRNGCWTLAKLWRAGVGLFLVVGGLIAFIRPPSFQPQRGSESGRHPSFNQETQTISVPNTTLAISGHIPLKRKTITARGHSSPMFNIYKAF